jgi:hypothetical protein
MKKPANKITAHNSDKSRAGSDTQHPPSLRNYGETGREQAAGWRPSAYAKATVDRQFRFADGVLWPGVPEPDRSA